MKTIRIVVAIAVGLFAALSAQQQSYAQYDSTGTVGVSEETLKKCEALNIAKTQCSDSTVLAKERVGMIDGEGSGTAFIAKESGQMTIFIGVLGAIFGGVAGAFFVMGKAKQLKTA